MGLERRMGGYECVCGVLMESRWHLGGKEALGWLALDRRWSRNDCFWVGMQCVQRVQEVRKHEDYGAGTFLL